MKQVMSFGEYVEGFNVEVLNEREIRAAAGILFLLSFSSFMVCQLTRNFVMLKYVITVFLVDMSMQVFISPRYAPSLIMGRFMVRNQNPEYVWAKPKKFAWMIGFSMAALLFSVQVAANIVSPVTGLTCLACLTFLFFEASFGICLGCKFYSMIYKDKPQLCPGGTCEDNPKSNIQKISSLQILVLSGFFIFIMIMMYYFNDTFIEKPLDIFGIGNSAK